MAVREKGHLPAGCVCPSYHAAGSKANVLDGFAVGYTVAPEVPVRAFLADFRGGQTFIGSVIPFEQIRIDFSAICVSGEAAGFSGSL
jgi:hypothetical protein